jgi:hypothetical protein
MTENISMKLYYFATVRQFLEDKTRNFVKNTTELEKSKGVKDPRVIVLTDQARCLLAELQVVDNHLKMMLKMPLTTQLLMDELVSLRKMEMKYYDYCAQYNEILQSMLVHINSA